MSELPMRGHFRYLRFKTFSMTPRTPQCEVFFPFFSSSEHSGVPEGSQPPTFPSVGLHPHTWPKWGCDSSKPPTFPSVGLHPHTWPKWGCDIQNNLTSNIGPRKLKCIETKCVCMMYNLLGNRSAFCEKQGHNSKALLCLLWSLCHETQPLEVLAAGPPYLQNLE